MKKLERLWAIVWKEWLQVFRDPSALLIAFVFPAIMLFLFGYGLSLDSASVRIGVVLEDDSPLARSFYNSLDASKYFDARYYSSRTSAERALRDETVRAVVVVPNDFSIRVESGELGAIQTLADGGEPNLALLVENYVRAAFVKWTSLRAREVGALGLSSKSTLKRRRRTIRRRLRAIA